jgi:hypothetical protein
LAPTAGLGAYQYEMMMSGRRVSLEIMWPAAAG